MHKPVAAIHEVTGPEFRNFFRHDHSLDLEMAFHQLDTRTVEVAMMLRLARNALMEPHPCDTAEIAAVLTGCLATLAAIVEPFDQIYRATGTLRARDAGRGVQPEGR